MVDTRTPEQRRRIMAAVRSADTEPELRLRRALHAAGLRGWRCHYKGARGTPDMAWPALRVAVFVDGAFWHGHPSRHRPGRSGAYWDEKIARNVERDRQADAALKLDGWTVIRVWDFEVARDLDSVVKRVVRAVCEHATMRSHWQRRLAERHPASAGSSRERPRAPAVSFGETLRSVRLREGIGREQLARASGLYGSTIAAYERGAREPRLEAIVTLARALGVSPETLVRSLGR